MVMILGCLKKLWSFKIKIGQGDSDRRVHLVHNGASNAVAFLILNNYILCGVRGCCLCCLNDYRSIEKTLSETVFRQRFAMCILKPLQNYPSSLPRRR